MASDRPPEMARGSEASPTARVTNVRKQLRNLTALLDVSRAMMAQHDLDTLLHMIMEHVKEVVEAERSSLFLLDAQTGELHSRIAQNLEIREIRFPVGRGIAGYSARARQIVNIRDAYHDSRFNREVDRLTGFRTRSILCAPLLTHRDEVLGVVQVLNKVGGGVFGAEDEQILAAFASQAAVALENAQLYAEQDRMMTSFLKTLAAAIDARDPVTAGHSERVARYAVSLGRALGLPPADLRALDIAAALHDIGKLGIRDSVLLKPARLSEEEYDHIKEHASRTIDILRRMDFARDLRDVPAIAGAHHERLNGKGYPNGLKGDALSQHARILAIADVYDALTAYDRPYKRAMSEAEALAILEREKGESFDPALVDLFRSKQVCRLERREHRRIDLELAIEYRPLSPEEAAQRAGVTTTTLDVSGGGMLFVADRPISVGTFLEVVLRLPDAAFTVVGKVVRSLPIRETGHEVGLRFINLPAAVKDRLARYLVELNEEGNADARA